MSLFLVQPSVPVRTGSRQPFILVVLTLHGTARNRYCPVFIIKQFGKDAKLLIHYAMTSSRLFFC
ncbi:hypothetical protein [Salipaludibacillus agaradhaerens]|uniref:hypothetical protein n=1 Tax=Salipaludibacillus agaradhaerens TaxID=76935 RepID=UPI002151250C|nr:hypothetical protein [Salipaludibacillus agaradhaerens]